MSNPELNPNEYQCAVCHNIYERDWSEEEAKAELEANFGDIDTDACDVVCDDCYQQFISLHNG